MLTLISSVSFMVVFFFHIFCGQSFQNNPFDSETVPAFVKSVATERFFRTRGADAKHSVSCS